MLEKYNIPFEILVTSTSEKNHHEGELTDFRHLACENAMRKVESAASIVMKSLQGNKTDEEILLIGADTIVVIDDRLLPKPGNKEEARTMLESLSGRTHRVITGVAILSLPHKRLIEDFEETEVTFRKLNPREIDNYIKTGEYADKAGAYGIQGYGVFLVESIRGDYPNVVGLPMTKLYMMLKKFGVDLMISHISPPTSHNQYVLYIP